MKKILGFAGATALWALPVLMVSADGGFTTSSAGGPFGNVVTALTTLIESVLVPLVLILAFIAFLWGVFLYFVAGGANEEKRETGKSFMIYAIAGFVLIAVLWALVTFVANTLGLEQGGTAVQAPFPTDG